MKKIALITGITGQDGSYLAEILLKKLHVHGITENRLRLTLKELIIYDNKNLKKILFMEI